MLGINGPISTHPGTYIWVRAATLDFYAPGKLSQAREVKLEVDPKDPALDSILQASAFAVQATTTGTPASGSTPGVGPFNGRRIAIVTRRPRPGTRVSPPAPARRATSGLSFAAPLD